MYVCLQTLRICTCMCHLKSVFVYALMRVCMYVCN